MAMMRGPVPAGQGGFRGGLEAFDRQPLHGSGDAYDGSVGQTNADEVALTGGNVVGRWTHHIL